MNRSTPARLAPLVLILIFAGMAALLWGAGLRAAAAADPQVWACGESLKVQPTTAMPSRNAVWNVLTGQVRLHGARQEYVGFQVVVRAGDAPLDRVEVRVTPPRSAAGKELAGANIDLFRQHYLRVTVPSEWEEGEPVPEAAAGEYPVQMVPLRAAAPGAAFNVPAGRNQPVWVDLYVPEDQAAGDYDGEVQVTAAGKPLATLKLRLTVWGFALPRETHLKTFLYTGPEQLRWAFGLKPSQATELRALEDRFFQMAHQHRLNFIPSGGDDLQEEWGERYRRYLDGTGFKERAGAGVGQNLLVIGPGGESKEEITAYVKQARDWWKRQNLPAELVCYVYDEPREPEEFQTVAQRARWIREAVGKEIPIFLTTVTPEKVPPGLIDIWGEIPAPTVPARQKAGERVWAVNHGYAGGPFVDTPGYAGRSQGWMAWKMGLDGWQFWDACYWVDRHNIRDAAGKRVASSVINANPKAYLTDTWTNPLTFDQKRNPKLRHWIRLNGDGALFYPGTPAGLQEPLAGFTMKSLRRGLQDYEYLWLLRQKGKSADDVVNRVVPRPNEWARDADTWDEARLELGRRLHALSAAP